MSRRTRTRFSLSDCLVSRSRRGGEGVMEVVAVERGDTDLKGAVQGLH